MSQGSWYWIASENGAISPARPPVATTVASPSSFSMRDADAVDLRGEPVDGAGLDRLGRVLADHAARLDQLDAEQRGGAAVQRVEADLDAGKDRAAEVLALGRDRFERRRGAEVDDDRRAAVEVEGGDRVGDAVGADLLRVVVEDRHAGLHARLDDDRGEAEVALGHLAHRGGDARHRRAQRHAVDVLVEAEAVEAEELLHEQRELVRRALGRGRDAPVVEQVALGARAWRLGVVVEPVQPDDGLGVADVDGEQH